MSELEEAELTEGQGRALSQQKTAHAYRGYAKETMLRPTGRDLQAARVSLLAQRQLEEENSTEFPNGGRKPFPNAPEKPRGTNPFR